MMNISTKQWTTASPLPQPLHSLSGATCGDRLYLAGGYAGGYKDIFQPTKSVLTCSLTDLLPQSLGASLRRAFSLTGNTRVWKEVCSSPVSHSTLTTLGGYLLAIGGEDDRQNFTANVRRYDLRTDSWHVISQMEKKRSRCLAAVLPGDRLIAVGGYLDIYKIANIKTDSVEMFVE